MSYPSGTVAELRSCIENSSIIS